MVKIHSYFKKLTAVILCIAMMLPIMTISVKKAHAETPLWSKIVYSVGAVGSATATAACTALCGPAGTIAGTCLSSLTLEGLGLGLGFADTKETSNEEIAKKVDALSDKIDEQTDQLIDEYKKETEKIIENENRNTKQVLSVIAQLSNNASQYHAEAMKALSSVNFKINTRDFLAAYDQVALNNMEFYNTLSYYVPENLKDNYDGLHLDRETYDFYCQVLDTNTCSFTADKAALDQLVRYLEGSSALTNGPAYEMYLNETKQYCDSINESAATIDGRIRIDTNLRNAEGVIQTVQAQANIAVTSILSLLVMQYDCSEYELAHPDLVVHTHKLTAHQFDQFVVDGEYSLKKISQILEDRFNQVAQDAQKIATKVSVSYDKQITENGRIGTKTVDKDFYDFPEAWKTAFKLSLGGAKVTIHVYDDVESDPLLGFADQQYSGDECYQNGFTKSTDWSHYNSGNGDLYIKSGLNITIVGEGETRPTIKGLRCDFYAGKNTNISFSLYNLNMANCGYALMPAASDTSNSRIDLNVYNCGRASIDIRNNDLYTFKKAGLIFNLNTEEKNGSFMQNHYGDGYPNSDPTVYWLELNVNGVNQAYHH